MTKMCRAMSSGCVGICAVKGECAGISHVTVMPVFGMQLSLCRKTLEDSDIVLY